MKRTPSLLLMLLVGCASDPRATNLREYVTKANSTYLAETVNDGPKDEKEREIFDKIDALFIGAPGYRPYKEDIGKRVILPKLLHMEHATYPAWARQLWIPAKVILAVRVNKDGSIMELKVFDTTDARFNDAAVSAVKKWKFSGGLTEGVPDTFVMVIPIEFIL